LMQVRQYDVEHALPTQQLIVKQPELQAELDHESKEGEMGDKKADKKIATDNKPEVVHLNKDSDVFDTENDNKQPEPEPKQKPKEHLLDNRYKAIHKSSGHALARLKFKQVKNSFRFPRAKK
ncbi:MAG: mechanosensitive ion channel family protein, partial [Psychrobacter glacincola]